MKKIIALLCILNLLSLTAYADFDIVAFDRDVNTINVSGNAGTESSNRLVSIVLKCNENVSDIKLVRTDENSDFECSFSIADVSGTYEVLYQIPKSEEKVNAYLDVYSSTEIKEAIEAFATAETSDEIESAFLIYSKVLGISDELLAKVSDSEVFYTRVLKGVKDAKTVRDIVDFVNETIIVQIFNEASASQICDLLSQYDLEIGISASTVYEYYDEFDTVRLNAFKEKMDTYTISSLSDIFKAFETCTVLTEIQYASYYTDTQFMIETYYDKIYLDMTDYKKLSSSKKSDVSKGLTGYCAYNDSDIESKWETLIKEVSKNTSNSNTSNDKKSSGTGKAVSVETKPNINVEVVSFVDLAEVQWAKDAILSLANKGIINGKSQYCFYPNDDITRAEFVKILVGALGFDISTYQCGFDDVQPGDWAYPYVCTAVDNKIATGYSDTEFGVDDKITRQDMVTMVMRALNRKGEIITSSEQELTFEDTANIDDYALENVETAVSLGIVNGMGDNRFEPKAFATRAQAAVLISHSCQTELAD